MYIYKAKVQRGKNVAFVRFPFVTRQCGQLFDRCDACNPKKKKTKRKKFRASLSFNLHFILKQFDLENVLGIQ